MASGTAISDAEWQKFHDEYAPFLEKVEADIASRRGDYVSRAIEGTQRTNEQMEATVENRQSSIGVGLTQQQADQQAKLMQLNASTSETAAANTAIDTADQVNQGIARMVTNSQTDLISSAIQDQESGSGLANSRQVQNANARAQNSQQNAALAGTALTAIAMMV